MDTQPQDSVFRCGHKFSESMRPWKDIVREIRKVVDYLNDFEWECVGTIADLHRDIEANPKRLPTCVGVYKITNEDRDYIGRALRQGGLRRRIKEHLKKSNAIWNDPESQDAFKVKIIRMENKDEIEARLLARITESSLIEIEKPILNRNGKRG